MTILREHTMIVVAAGESFTLSLTGWAVIGTMTALRLGWMLFSARWWPYTACRHCLGGRHRDRGGDGSHWRLCHRCHGTGTRTRLLYRLFWQHHTGTSTASK